MTRIGLDEVSVQGRIARGARVWQASDKSDDLVAVACYGARNTRSSKARNGNSTAGTANTRGDSGLSES